MQFEFFQKISSETNGGGRSTVISCQKKISLASLIISRHLVFFTSKLRSQFEQWCKKLDNWGGAHIHMFELTDHENNRFQTKLTVQNMNI